MTTSSLPFANDKVNKIGFYGHLMGAGTNHGYGYSAQQLILAWNRKGMPVWWADNEAAIGFHFVQPFGYERLNEVNIGYTPWESTKLPYAWPFYMNKMSEIWTTSYACKEWFENGGIERPIRVLHHGINREHYPLQMREKKADEPFRFLHVGEPSERKGGEMVYETFKELYANRDDVILVIKGKPRFDVNIDNVYVIEDYLDQESLSKLFLKCHAMAYPTNGEGFGLIPFQAAATGMPTAVTEWGGSLDYIDHCWRIRVADMVECHYEPHEGLWAMPDKEDMKFWMQWAFEDHKVAFEDAYHMGAAMDKYWSWDYIAEVALNWFREIVGDI